MPPVSCPPGGPINLVPSDAVVLLLTLALFSAGLRLRGWWRLPALSGVAAVGLFGAYYLHIVDTPAYYALRSVPAVDLAPALVGLTMGVLTEAVLAREDASSRPAGLAAGALIALVAVGVCFARPWLRPHPTHTLTDTWADGVCLQSTLRTCGPCTAATILRHLGHPVTERQLAVEARTDGGGTLNWLLIRALRQRGFAADFQQPASLEEVQPPAILGVKLGTAGHFIALLAVEGDTLHIGEPLEGPLTLSRAEFAARYDFDHFAVPIRE